MRKLYAIYETALFVIKDKDGRLVAYSTRPRATDKGVTYRYTDNAETTVSAIYEDIDKFNYDYPYYLDGLCRYDGTGAFFENKNPAEFEDNKWFRFTKNEFVSVTVYHRYKEVDDKAPNMTLTTIMSNLSIDEFLLYVKDRMDRLE